MKLIIQPDDGIAPLLVAIKRAKKTIDIVIFRFDRMELEKALAAAVGRGVVVRALVAHTNRGGEKRLRKLEMAFLASGVTVCRTADDLARHHGKMMIVDGELHVFGFNYTELDINRSRSFGLSTKDSSLVKAASALFQADSTRQPYEATHDRLVISPETTRKHLTHFIKGAKKALPGVQIVGKEFTNDKATDFNAILTTIKGKNPDLVFFGGMDSVGGPLLRQMKALGIKAKYMGGDGICTEPFAKLAGDAATNGTVICAEAGGVSPEQQKNMDDFVARYKKKYNADVQIYAPYVYDAIMTMATAMADAKSSQPAKYLPFLHKIKYQGVTGLISFDPKGDIKDGALTLFTYTDGKKTKVEVVK